MTDLASNTPSALNSSDSGPLERIRLRRAYRYAAAKQLNKLLKVAEPTVVTEVANRIDIADLDVLPHWCLLDGAPMRELQHVCAAVFLGPALQASIDGFRLKGWRELLGSDLFDAIMTEESVVQIADAPYLPEGSAELLQSTGASVLLSTLLDHPAQPLMQQCTGDHNGLLNYELSMSVYLAASALHHRMQFDSSTTEPA